MKLIVNKSLNFLILLLVSFLGVQAQIADPVKWSTAVTKIDDANYEVIFKATIDEGWHVYSQFIEGDDGPIPTEFDLKADGIEKIGKTTEPKGFTAFDKTFQMEIKYFENEALFTQKIAVSQNYKDPVTASVFYMVCNDERCLPPEEELFEVYLNSKPKTSTVVPTAVSDSDKSLSKQLELPLKKTEQFVISTTKKKTLWKLFFLGFLGGFIALLTPCVFPMIPLTVSFFSHSSGSSRQGVFKALLYGFFICLLYTSPSPRDRQKSRMPSSA